MAFRLDRYRAKRFDTTIAIPGGQILPGDTVVKNEQLWAPWRLTYVQGDADKPSAGTDTVELPPGADPTCFICRAAASTDDRQNLVVHRGRRMLTILNRYPYNNGHLLIAPLRHKGRLDELSTEEQTESLSTITRLISVLEQSLKCEGFNVGLNLGRVAGAGLPGHLHWHIVPRWSGDTNFMPVLAGVGVISQSLDALWDTLSHGLRAP